MNICSNFMLVLDYVSSKTNVGLCVCDLISGSSDFAYSMSTSKHHCSRSYSVHICQYS